MFSAVKRSLIGGLLARALEAHAARAVEERDDLLHDEDVVAAVRREPPQLLLEEQEDCGVEVPDRGQQPLVVLRQVVLNPE
jgi:hypothetical protein